MDNKTKPLQIPDWTWVTRDKVVYKVREMKRSHVQNALQWCIRNRPERSIMHDFTNGGDLIDWEVTKDGHTYDEWIMAFTVRLLDPECE